MPHGNGWRVKVKLFQTQANGPIRPTRRGAQIDLGAARQCASRDELLQFVIALSQRVETISAAPQLQNNDDVDPTAPGDGAHIAGAGAQAVAKYLKSKTVGRTVHRNQLPEAFHNLATMPPAMQR